VTAAVVVLVVGVVAVVAANRDDRQRVTGVTTSAPSPAPAGFEDTDWVLVHARQGSLPIVSDRAVRLSFTRCTDAACPVGRYRIGGSDGCNEFGGAVDITERELQLHGIGSTLVGCGDQLSPAVSRVFLTEGAVPYERDGDTLRLTAGPIELEYRRTAARLPEAQGDVVAEGQHDGDQWRLSSRREGDMITLELTVREHTSTAVGGGAVGTSIGSTETSDSDQIVALGTGELVYGIAPARATRVTAQVEGEDPVELRTFAIPGADLKAFGGYTEQGMTTTRIYDASGQVFQEEVHLPTG
jgi:hypothetical protein